MAITLHIIMYHYVRPLKHSRYPEIKGLEKEGFLGQLDYIQHHYTVVSMQQVAEAMKGGEPLPDRSALLTFDDGYLDHYLHVFPHLMDRDLSGAFFPPVCAVGRQQVLDVNKIQFILASVANKDDLVAALNRALEEARSQFDLQSIADYQAEWKKPGRYDTDEVIYFKRMLQHVPPKDLRQRITDDLFRRFVSADEAAFANELYVDAAQLRVMIEAGMHVGGHGDAHCWLNQQDEATQRAEIEKSRAFLDKLGATKTLASFCYPYGGYNKITQKLLTEHGFELAVTTEPRGMDFNRDTLLALPRLDTNDLPRSGDVTFVEQAC